MKINHFFYIGPVQEKLLVRISRDFTEPFNSIFKHLCEQDLSKLIALKINIRINITISYKYKFESQIALNIHVERYLRLKLFSFNPDIDSLMVDKQCSDASLVFVFSYSCSN